jgi:hypothetical protein
MFFDRTNLLASCSSVSSYILYITEGRRKKEEGRRKKEEGRRKD